MKKYAFARPQQISHHDWCLRTEEGAIVPWLIPQELKNEQRAPRRNRGFQHMWPSAFQTLLCFKRSHWQLHCIFLSSLGSHHKRPRRPAMTRLNRASSHKRLWRHEAVKLKASYSDKTVHNKSYCAAWTHVSRDNYTNLYMYAPMDIYVHILTYVYLHTYICL